MIAKSFAFIYGRNQPNLGLLGIVLTDEKFYDVATEGRTVEIDLARGVISVFEGEMSDVLVGEWEYTLSDMERELIAAGGLTSAFRRFGKGLFEVMCTPKPKGVTGKGAKGKVNGEAGELAALQSEDTSCGNTGGLQW